LPKQRKHNGLPERKAVFYV